MRQWLQPFLVAPAAMAQEIERKFLVVDDAWRSGSTGVLYKQGYVPTKDARTVRVRLVGDQGYLTLKGPAVGLVRPEFEYPIPAADAEAILHELCQPPWIEKYRYCLTVDGLLWEIDEFLGDNRGLVLAEVELDQPDQSITLPPWIGQEVTDDPRYLNANLVHYSYTLWAAQEEQSENAGTQE